MMPALLTRPWSLLSFLKGKHDHQYSHIYIVSIDIAPYGAAPRMHACTVQYIPGQFLRRSNDTLQTLQVHKQHIHLGSRDLGPDLLRRLRALGFGPGADVDLGVVFREMARGVLASERSERASARLAGIFGRLSQCVWGFCVYSMWRGWYIVGENVHSRVRAGHEVYLAREVGEVVG